MTDAIPTHFFGISRETTGARKSWVYEAELRQVKLDRREMQAMAAALTMPVGAAGHLQTYHLYGRKGLVPKEEFVSYNFFVIQGPGFLRGAYVPNSWGSIQNAVKSAEWVAPDRQGETYIFASGGLIVKLLPTRRDFEAKQFETLAFSGASLVKFNRTEGPSCDNPYSLDGVLCLASDGVNQSRGLFKFPGWPVVLPMRGVKVGEEIWLEAEREDEVLGFWSVSSTHARLGWTSGLYKLNQYKSTLRIKLTATTIQLSLGLDFGKEFRWAEDLHDLSRQSLEVPFDQLKSLDALSQSYKAHFGQRLWETSDEPASFSHEADVAYIESGLPIGMPNFYRTTRSGDAERDASELSTKFRARLLALKAQPTPMRMPFLR